MRDRYIYRETPRKRERERKKVRAGFRRIAWLRWSRAWENYIYIYVGREREERQREREIYICIYM